MPAHITQALRRRRAREAVAARKRVMERLEQRFAELRANLERESEQDQRPRVH